MPPMPASAWDIRLIRWNRASPGSSAACRLRSTSISGALAPTTASLKPGSWRNRAALSDRNALLIDFQGGLVNAEGGVSSRAVDHFFIGGADFRGFAPRRHRPEGRAAISSGRTTVSSAASEVQRDIDQILGTPTRDRSFRGCRLGLVAGRYAGRHHRRRPQDPQFGRGVDDAGSGGRSRCRFMSPSRWITKPRMTNKFRPQHQHLVTDRTAAGRIPRRQPLPIRSLSLPVSRHPGPLDLGGSRRDGIRQVAAPVVR